MSIYLKQIMLAEPLAELNQVLPTQAIDEMSLYYGVKDLGILGTDVAIGWIMLAIVLLSAVFLTLALRQLQKRIIR